MKYNELAEISSKIQTHRKRAGRQLWQESSFGRETVEGLNKKKWELMDMDSSEVIVKEWGYGGGRGHRRDK